MGSPAIISQTFTALRHRNYRIYLIGQVFSLSGTWMQFAAQGYLLYELTKSPAYLGYVAFIDGVPAWLFTLYGGIIADRIPRRTLLLITQSFMMTLAFILSALVFTDLVAPWHILVLAFFLGVGNAFEAPARQSFTIELVTREDLTNAISLNAAMFNAANIVGPAIGGLVYAWVGPGWCFSINGLSFIAVILALVLIRLPRFTPPPQRNIMMDVQEGFQFIRQDATVRFLILAVGIVSIFSFSLQTLIPAWATNVLKGDVRTNGMLLAARGAGALMGALTLASLSGRNIRGKLWLIGSFVLPLGMLSFSWVRNLPISLIMLATTGWAMMALANNTNALIQSGVPDHLRGRVMGIYTLVFLGFAPVGSLIIGWLATWLGEPAALQIFAAVLLTFAVWVTLRHPEIRALR
ncbi:MAG: MFS transporter [Anaerolineaceae bacterium]|nr:MFS transporter [Anaerolineaceae bacterium]